MPSAPCTKSPRPSDDVTLVWPLTPLKPLPNPVLSCTLGGGTPPRRDWCMCTCTCRVLPAPPSLLARLPATDDAVPPWPPAPWLLEEPKRGSHVAAEVVREEEDGGGWCRSLRRRASFERPFSAMSSSYLLHLSMRAAICASLLSRIASHALSMLLSSRTCRARCTLTAAVDPICSS
jgi:hypothetical protein